MTQIFTRYLYSQWNILPIVCRYSNSRTEDILKFTTFQGLRRSYISVRDTCQPICQLAMSFLTLRIDNSDRHLDDITGLADQKNWMIYRQRLIVGGKGFTHINLKMKKVTDFDIYIPKPLEEQQDIAFYLDAKTDTIDKIITNIQTQISILIALRKTLINDVVTNTLKVCDD